jgi:putative membrane protein
MSIRRVALIATVVGLFLAPGTAASAAPSSQDSTYLKAAHQVNLAEIAGSKIAEQKADSQQVKDLATRFITDHTKLDAALTKTASAVGVSLPSAPNAQQQALAARYQATSGKQFDTLFVSTQLQGHMAAMNLGQTEIANGSDAQVKKAAQDAAPVIQGHAQLLEAAARALGIPSGINTGTGGQAARTTIRPAAVSLIAIGLLFLAGAAFLLRRRRTIEA